MINQQQQPAPQQDFKYGSFLGSPDPLKGDAQTGDSAARLIEYVIDRATDELLTSDQIIGALEYAAAAIEARDTAAAGLIAECTAKANENQQLHITCSASNRFGERAAGWRQAREAVRAHFGWVVK